MVQIAPPPPGLTRVNESEGTFSERFPILFEETGRLRKAEKVNRVLTDYFRGDARSKTAVDVGCSTGIMTRHYAGAFGRVIGLDTDGVGVRHGAVLALEAGLPPSRLQFCGGDGCIMPLADNSVDAIICNQVYEHVDDQPGLMREIHRVLRPGGACYFGIGTRHVLIEGHYKLPFLSWMPHWAADWYMKLAGMTGRYDVVLLSYRKLKKLVREFAVIDYTIDIIKRPEAYADDERGPIRRWVEKWPVWLLRAMLPGIPIHVWVLIKPGESTAPAGSHRQRYCGGTP